MTVSRKSRGDAYKNLTKGLEITRPFQVLSSDISHIRTGEGFDYLCQIRDVYSNTVLAFCQTENMKKELVLKTLKAAQDRWHLPADVLFHSDRGSQYTSTEVMAQVTAYGWQQSFSEVGKPGDNAWSESFFSILKKEIIHWHFYPTREAARQATFEYINVRIRIGSVGYNTHPMHIHGHQLFITASDGNTIPNQNRLMKSTVNVASGETYDIEFTTNNPGTWPISLSYSAPYVKQHAIGYGWDDNSIYISISLIYIKIQKAA